MSGQNSSKRNSFHKKKSWCKAAARQLQNCSSKIAHSSIVCIWRAMVPVCHTIPPARCTFCSITGMNALHAWQLTLLLDFSGLTFLGSHLFHNIDSTINCFQPLEFTVRDTLVPWTHAQPLRGSKAATCTHQHHMGAHLWLCQPLPMLNGLC